MPADSLRVWVQAEENSLVDQGVLVLGPRTLLVLRVGRTDDGLNLITVDETSDVGVGNFGGRQASEIIVRTLCHPEDNQWQRTCNPS